MSEREAQLADAYAALKTRLQHAAQDAGRDMADIELLPVTKFFPAADVAILAALGADAFGESREREAADKVRTVAELIGDNADSLRWHMIGQIQRNKAKSIAAWAHAAHSVSSERLVAALDRAALAAMDEGVRTEPLDIYIQLSLDGDIDRGGVDIADSRAVDEICAQVGDAESLRLRGVMGIPPLGADTDAAFERLRQERDRVCLQHPQATGLSAGMSGDLESAVKHGSTCVRVGTALMGTRPLTSP
jgi:pyridoxal phosphate enzyme (YggS family)